MSRHRADLREVEQSPDGRYVRFDEKLGTGAYKEVFLAYDTETGKEVAWNTVNLARLPAAEKRRIRMETEILAELQHPHIINFYHVWESPEKDQICFTTEIVTSGTLKQYVARVRNIKLKVIKKWCRQILTALEYLHGHEVPIIHRDLKSDNIFINGSSSSVRLGDFGLSAHRTCTHVASVLGTPEFMAPELYDENYSEQVDIYAFGMTVLEMATKEYPYEECSNAAQIWKKVTGGLKPDVLQRVHDQQVREFITLCICPPENRLSASELLAHPFLSFRESDTYARENSVVTVEPKVTSRPPSRPTSRPSSSVAKDGQLPPSMPIRSPSPSPSPQHGSMKPPPQPKPLQHNGSPNNNNANIFFQQQQQSLTPQPPHTLPSPNNTYGDGPPSSAPAAPAPTGVTSVMVEIESASGPIANIVLHIHLDGGRRKKQIKFAFDFRQDTSMSLAGEMVQSLKLPDGERTQMLIGSAMESRIDPVRKHYFAGLASEASPTPVEESASQQPPALPVFQHTSFTTSTAPSTPSHAPVSLAQQQQQAHSSAVFNGQRAANGTLPMTQPIRQTSVPVQPTAASTANTRPATANPANISATAGPKVPTGTAAVPSATARPQNTPVVPPQAKKDAAAAMAADSTTARSPTPTTGRPISQNTTRVPTGRQSLPPPAPSPTPILTSNHKHSASCLPLGADFPGSVAAGAHELLTLDSFASSEEYESYLQSEFKAMSVSMLKERLRTRPGGGELVKACFEKPDLIQLLIRITVQEQHTPHHPMRQQQGSNVAASAFQQQNTSNHARPHQSFSEAPDFLSPDPTPSAAQSPRSPSFGGAHAIISPDPFLGLDAMLGSPEAQSFSNLSQAGADHRFASKARPTNANTATTAASNHPTPPAAKPSTKPSTPTLDTGDDSHAASSHSHPDSTRQPSGHHHAHHSIDSLPSALTTPTATASSFPFSPVGPFSNHSDSGHSQAASDTISEADLVSEVDTQAAFDYQDARFQVSVTSPTLTPDVGLDSAVDFLSPQNALSTRSSHARTHTSHDSNSAQSYDLLGDAPRAPRNSHARSASQDRSRARPTLGGVLEDANEADPTADEGNSLSDLMSQSGGASLMESPRAPQSRQMTLDPELNAFFDQPRKPKTDAHHTPGNLSLDTHQRAANSNKTLPANFNLTDMFSPTQPPPATATNGVSATGTKAQRSHTAADVDTFDPLRSEEVHAFAISQSMCAPMSQVNAKQARTKSEADQAEANIMQFQI